MTDKGVTTKKKIINATIQLVREEMDVKKITVRGIARRAGVAKSVINYHFQSKESLIDKAVQSFIGSIISEGDIQLQRADLTPVARLRGRVKRAATFLALYPGISRVSIFRDLKDGDENDNSSQSLESIFNQLKEIYGDKRSDLELKLKAQQLLAALQEIFLRAPVFKQQTGIDYYNEEQRDELMDRIIDNILNDL